MRSIPIAIAVVVMIVSAVVQGVWDERWTKFPELKEYAARLDNVPKDVGDWKGEVVTESDEEILKAAGAERILTITYHNTSTNEIVHMNLVCARLQDIFYHTPERCYRAHGFEQVTDTSERSVDCGAMKADFKTATFKRTTETSKENLRIFWSWTANGPWGSPSNPKWTYKGQPVLYKIYVENAADEGGGAVEGSPSIKFIRAFMPELNKGLFPQKTETSAVAAN